MHNIILKTLKSYDINGRTILTMADNKICGSIGQARDLVCIDTYRVLDSCRDKDCFEDVRVYLTDYGQEVIDRTSAVRAKCAKILWAYIDIDDVPFNRGFYQLTIRLYIKVVCEACVSPGNIQELEGVAVVEKKVVLFGSEGNVNVFKSDPGCSGFCPSQNSNKCKASNNLPIAVLEAVDPIVLNSKVVEPKHPCCCCCCCCVEDIPENVSSNIEGVLSDDENGNKLLVSLGLFSVVRLQRPAQYLVNAAEYCVPAKECKPVEDDDPCSLFRKMEFPVSEFCPPSVSGLMGNDQSSQKRCGCNS